MPMDFRTLFSGLSVLGTTPNSVALPPGLAKGANSPETQIMLGTNSVGEGFGWPWESRQIYKKPLKSGYKPLYDFTTGEYSQVSPAGLKEEWIPAPGEPLKYGYPNPGAAAETRQGIAAGKRAAAATTRRAQEESKIREQDKTADFNRRQEEARTTQANTLEQQRVLGQIRSGQIGQEIKGKIDVANTEGGWNVAATNARGQWDASIAGTQKEAQQYTADRNYESSLNTNISQLLAAKWTDDTERYKTDEANRLASRTLDMRQSQYSFDTILRLIEGIQGGFKDWATAAVAPFR